MFKVQLLPAFDDNYIFCLMDHRGQTWVIDPGDAAVVSRFLQNHRLSLTAILCTHHHHDHVGGNRQLAQQHGVPVYGPSARIPAITEILKAGQYRIAGADVEVMETPGHTLDHIAYRIGDLLVCGDTLFAAGCGRLFEGSAAQMFHSLRLLAALPEQTQVYCAHEYTLQNLRFAQTVEPGEPAINERLRQAQALRQQGLPTIPSSIGLEQRTNPFLRSHLPALGEAARRFDPSCDGDPVAVFAALRRWKDVFV